MSNAPAFTRLFPNLASAGLGAEVVFATDDFFADKARLIADHAPVWKEDVYDDHGKWMDGWESRRRRNGGHDYAIIKLAGAGVVEGVTIDTAHFTGNYSPAASLEACAGDEVPTGDDPRWQPLLPAHNLGPSAEFHVPIEADAPVQWLKLNMHPDGGIARLRVYGHFVQDWARDIGTPGIELSALRRGGRIVGYNNAHYGTPNALISEGRGKTMGDGWETRRRREPGYDWIIVELGHVGTIERIEIDTAHFKGNFPDRASLHAGLATGDTDKSIITKAMFWEPLMDEQKLQADHVHVFEGEALKALGPISHVRLNIFPDGGISRLRVIGTPKEG